MAISRARKEELVAQYRELLNGSNGFAVIQSSGLTVPQIQELRLKVQAAGGQYMVVKNTLVRRALQDDNWVVPEALLLGPTSIAFGKDDFPGVAKTILEYVKDAGVSEKMQITGGVMTGEILDPAGVEAISKLPSLDELRAQIAGLVVMPAQGIVNVIQAANSGIVNVLQAYLDKHEAGEDAA